MHACKLSRFSCVQLFGILWTVACQAPLSMGFSRQEHWIVLPCPPPRDLPDLGIKPASPVAPALQADSLLLSHQGSPNTGDLSSIPGQGTSSHVPQLIPARATPTQKKKKTNKPDTQKSHSSVSTGLCTRAVTGLPASRGGHLLAGEWQGSPRGIAVEFFRK